MAFGAAGCRGGKGTGTTKPLDTVDKHWRGTITPEMIRSVTQVMARDLLERIPADPSGKKVTIVVCPLDNRTMGELDPKMNMAQIRDVLIKFANDRVVFLDRNRFDEIKAERARKAEGEVEPTGNKPLRGAEYFLFGEVMEHSDSNASGLDVYLYFSFRLTNADTSEIIWSNGYERRETRQWGKQDR
jgi:hypothetical protein